jgi:G protein-coupled receptor GPR1
MKLIACNLFRCIWFLIYPVIALRNVRVTTVQQYCEVSGFFLALGTEAVGQ